MLAVQPGRPTEALLNRAPSAIKAHTPAQPKHNNAFNVTASPHNGCGWPSAILSATAARRDLRLKSGVMLLNRIHCNT